VWRYGARKSSSLCKLFDTRTEAGRSGWFAKRIEQQPIGWRASWMYVCEIRAYQTSDCVVRDEYLPLTASLAKDPYRTVFKIDIADTHGRKLTYSKKNMFSSRK